MGSCVTAGGLCWLTDRDLFVSTVVCVLTQVKGDPQKLDVSALWGTYQSNRIVRAASIHGMAREYYCRWHVGGMLAARCQQGW